MTAPTLRMPAPPATEEKPARPWWDRALRFAGRWGWIALVWTIRAVWRFTLSLARTRFTDRSTGWSLTGGQMAVICVFVLYVLSNILNGGAQ